MAKARTKLQWTEIDPASLSNDQECAYHAYKKAYAVMKDARVAFEETMQVGVPEGKRIICGYNFGKLSVALGEDDRKPAQAKASGNLADFLAQAQASGRRA